MTVSMPFVILASLCASLSAAAPQYSPSGQCKPMPGDPDWPSDNDWAALNQTVGGKLLAPSPPAIVCYPDGKPIPSNSSTACSTIGASWGDANLHASSPISADWPLWQNEACLPTNLGPFQGAKCNVKQYPKYVIDATSETDVQAGVKFAARSGVRLIVKATGHDFLGRSTAPGALSIWTHNMKGAAYSEAFIPENCASSSLGGKPALTYAAGMQMKEIYPFAQQYDKTPVAGADPNVGIGGWLLGGGHSTISTKYGLGVDNVVEMKVVTPAGDYVTANECQNKDLFWAFRGVRMAVNVVAPVI